MAAEDRGPLPLLTHPLIRRLLDSQGSGISFFKAVHLIQSLFPDAPRVGRQGPAEEERIRFRAELSLAFPKADIAGIEVIPREGGGGPRFEITASFLGLYGPASPLPAYYTEDLLGDDSDESLVREFLDIFHHRFFSLFYRIWEKYSYAATFQQGGSDPISRAVLCLSGLSPELSPPGGRIPRVRLLAYSGFLSQSPRSASSLRGLLSDYFGGVPVEVEQCIEQTLRIAVEEQNRLGIQNTTLLRNLTLGERLADRSATFRVKLGPVGLETFNYFLPPGEGAAHLEELVGIFSPDALDFELELWIRCDEVPALQLSGETAHLGWSSWLGAQPAKDQLVRFLFKGRPHDHR